MKKMADMMSKAGKWLLVFGIVISQLSFPLQVLADEVIDNNEVIADDSLVEDTEVQEDVVIVNYDELTSNEYEYTINSGESTIVTFSLESQGLVKEVTLDFSKRVYGQYHYAFEEAGKLLIINYVGNNIDLLNNYKNVTDLTKNLICNDSECIISGFGSDLVTVADILSYYDVEAFKANYNATVNITDGVSILADDAIVVNGYQLMIGSSIDEELLYASPTSLYTINRVGDIHVPSDGIIDAKDQETVLDDIILENEVTNTNDVNGDGLLNILDATDSTFMDVYNGEEVNDVLTNTLVLSNEEVLIGETVEVKLLVSGFTTAKIYGIEGLLNYDSSILKLTKVSSYVANEDETEDNLGYLNLENNKFAYVILNGFNNSEEAILTLEFEALAVGEVDININNILESYGKAFELENDNVTVSLVIGDPEDNKGGDVEEGETPEEDKKPEEDKPADSTDNTVEGTTTEVDKDTTVAIVTPVVKSNDYYINNLEIKGYDIDFDMYTYEYSITVGEDVDSLDFDVLLNNNKSIYYVEGNESFKEGENLVHLVVKAENGSTKTYTIKVVKEATDEDKDTVKDSATELEEEVEEENNASKTVIIVLIILVIIGLIYVIFKDDEEDNKDNKSQEKTVPKKSESVKIEKVESKSVKTTKTTKSTKNSNSTKKNTKKTNKK